MYPGNQLILVITNKDEIWAANYMCYQMTKSIGFSKKVVILCIFELNLSSTN